MKYHLFLIASVLATLANARFKLPTEMEPEERHHYNLGGSMRYKYGPNKEQLSPTQGNNSTYRSNSSNYVQCHLKLF